MNTQIKVSAGGELPVGAPEDAETRGLQIETAVTNAVREMYNNQGLIPTSDSANETPQLEEVCFS